VRTTGEGLKATRNGSSPPPLNAGFRADSGRSRGDDRSAQVDPLDPIPARLAKVGFMIQTSPSHGRSRARAFAVKRGKGIPSGQAFAGLIAPWHSD